MTTPRSRKTGETWGTPAHVTPVHPERFWLARFYDFNVFTERKRIEKLRYIHRNPVERGLVSSPEQWRWSSFRWYLSGEVGPVGINDTDIMVMKIRDGVPHVSPLLRDLGHTVSDFHYHDIRIIDPHRTYLSAQIPSKTTPAPLLRRRNQPALDRVAMDIAKLLDPLALRKNIEIIKPRQPESLRMNRCDMSWGAQVSPVLRDLGVVTEPSKLRTTPSFNA